MDKLNDREKLKKFLLKTYGTLTKAAVAAKISETQLLHILNGHSDLSMKRIGEFAIGWKVDPSVIIPLLSDDDKVYFKSIKSAFRKEYVEILPTS